MAAMLTLMLLELVEGSGEGAPPPFVVYEALLGFTNHIGTAMDVRDFLLLVEGALDKQTSDADKMTFAAMGLSPQAALKGRRVAKAVDALKVMRRMIQRSAAATHFVRWAQRLASADPVAARRLEKTLEMASQHGDEVADVIIDLLVATDKRWKDLDNLEAVLKAADDAPVVARALKAALDTNSPKLLQDVLTLAARHQPMTAKALSGMVKALKAANPPPAPSAARMRRMAANFPSAHKLWEDLDDVARIDPSTGLATPGFRKLLNQLTSQRKSGVYIQDAAEAAVSFAKKPSSQGGLDGVVDAFERRVVVPRSTTGQLDLSRQYDLSKRVQGTADEWLDIDVKNWTSFSASGRVARKEARKLQKDIILKWLRDPSPTAFEKLRWAVKQQAVSTPAKQQELIQWMLKQFDSRLVKSRIPKVQLDPARQAFQQALSRQLLEFF
jgi:hypothetical protein